MNRSQSPTLEKSTNLLFDYIVPLNLGLILNWNLTITLNLRWVSSREQYYVPFETIYYFDTVERKKLIQASDFGENERLKIK